MKTTTFIIFLLVFSVNLKAQKVGIGTNQPQALLHVADGSVLFSGGLAYPSNEPPATGAGVRMMWYPQKAAFRAGAITNTQWDSDSIGKYSFATGFDSKAKGLYAIALGYGSSATGDVSTAMGCYTNATSTYSTATGYFTTASGSFSTAIGMTSVASGPSSISIGSGCIASGGYATAFGQLTEASGETSTSMGYKSMATGYISMALGTETTASGDFSTAFGRSTTASGNYSTVSGTYSTASGEVSMASGYGSIASGAYSTAIGFGVVAKALGATSIGSYNDIFDSPTTEPNANDRLFQIGKGNYDYRSNALTILRNGNTGLGNTNPEYILDVSGNIRLRSVPGSPTGIWFDNPGTIAPNAFIGTNSENSAGIYIGENWRFLVYNNGNATLSGTLSQNSDARLKTNIQPLNNSLETISLLTGYHYLWKDSSRSMQLQTGVLAQEVENLMPELVSTDKNGIKSVNYSGLVPYLIESTKKLKKETENQNTELEKIKMQNEALKKLISQLNNRLSLIENKPPKQ